MRLQLQIWALVGALAGSSLGRPQSTSTTITSSSSSDAVATDSSTTTSATETTTQFIFATTATNITTSTLTGYKHPALKEPSLIIEVTTLTVTTYAPGPVTAYPAVLTQTFVSTETMEFRSTNSNGRSTTRWSRATHTRNLVSTVTDPNATTTEDVPYYPFFSPGADGGPTDDGTVTTTDSTGATITITTSTADSTSDTSATSASSATPATSTTAPHTTATTTTR